jgi:hypothetical protein
VIVTSNEFASGSTVDPLTGNPISDSVSAAHVTVAHGTVRADLAIQGPLVGYLIIGLDRGEAGYWDGSCPAAKVAEGRC